jgi:hypothetical protein
MIKFKVCSTAEPIPEISWCIHLHFLFKNAVTTINAVMPVTYGRKWFKALAF